MSVHRDDVVTVTEWKQLDERQRDLVLISAELRSSGWTFMSRSVWEVRWYPMKSTPELVFKAKEALARI